MLIATVLATVAGCTGGDTKTAIPNQTGQKTPTTMRWTKTFGSYGYDSARSVQQTSDGGYIITGTRSINTTGPGASNSVRLIKIDSAGDLVWEKFFPNIWNGIGWAVQQTSNGGYIVTGQSSGSIFLLKTDSEGNEEWEKSFYPGKFNGAGESVQQTSDGGYIITGYLQRRYIQAMTIKTMNVSVLKVVSGLLKV